MSAAVLEVSDAAFEKEVLKSDLPVMLDMWAPWCGPCRMVSPVIDNLAEANAGKIKACKVNVDDNPGTASRYGITSIPTVLLFKGGKEVPRLRMVGVQPKATYQSAIDEVLKA
jgi:thioredoxin 1